MNMMDFGSLWILYEKNMNYLGWLRIKILLG
jgi:hypothetical protein